MKFLVIVQDLRISGTSEGVVSRSFLSKLRKANPNSIIDVLYLKSYESDDQLNLLPVDSIESYVLSLKVPFITKWLNKLYWRLFHVSLNEEYVYKKYAYYIKKVNYNKYDHIFIRSSGLNFETILAADKLPILKKAILNFHDPYPLFWYAGDNRELLNLELFRLKKMEQIISQSKQCISPAHLLSQDLQFLYGSKKQFHTLPHQYDYPVFNLSDTVQEIEKGKKVTISYHGAIMFGRNIDIVLDAYQELLDSKKEFRENTEFVMRLRGQDNKRLRKKYSKTPNIIVLDTLSFAKSCYEQMTYADICIVLENGPLYSNVLVGKAPFLASLNKPILAISPKKSELRAIVKKDKYIATINDKVEVKNKLAGLIEDRMHSNAPVYPFNDYFGDDNFKKLLQNILDT